MCVCVCVCVCVCTYPPFCASRMLHKIIFKRGFNRFKFKVFFLFDHLLTKAQEFSLADYLQMVGWGIVGVLPFQRVQCKQPRPEFEIMSHCLFSNDSNPYTMHTSIYVCIYVCNGKESDNVEKN